MKQSLQLRIGQQLAMTPQLQQAIRLLQLSTLDLTAEIQENLETNPMLESVEEGQEHESQQEVTPDVVETGVESPPADLQAEATAVPSADTPADSAMEMTGTVEELPVDSSWEDVYDSMLPHAGPAASIEDRDLEAQNSQDPSLKEHLVWQLQMGSFSDRDLSIAMAIIDAIDDRGYLGHAIEEIYAEMDLGEGVEIDEVLAVLRQVQNFDPLGVGARDLGECLYLQLQQMPDVTQWLTETRELVLRHLDLLEARDYKRLMRELSCDEDAVRGMLALLQTLNPAPGEQISAPKTEYIVPDVFVFRDSGQWRVDLNLESVPRIRVNNNYASLVRKVASANDHHHMRQQLQEARWFVKSLKSRNETLLRVARFIVAYQEAYFDQGDEAMRPMVLADVASAVDMHESTISRVTTRKYMHTPRGIFELKYFFSSHVSTVSGGACSATAIRAVIKKLIAAEEVRKPLSDNKLAMLLQSQGINVARRTVAKYRESLAIPSSSDRRKVI